LLKQKYNYCKTDRSLLIYPFIKIKRKNNPSSTEALKLKEIPKHLVIIGGGVGIEWVRCIYVWSQSFGRGIYGPNYSGMDASLSKELKYLRNKGMKFYVSHKVQERNGDATVTVQAEKMPKEKRLH
jgi:pyruvate/2-oxoglutarate dehydrogenase complex dihydrolipoamide dehydrogenase (E3) component